MNCAAVESCPAPHLHLLAAEEVVAFAQEEKRITLDEEDQIVVEMITQQLNADDSLCEDLEVLFGAHGLEAHVGTFVRLGCQVCAAPCLSA